MSKINKISRYVTSALALTLAATALISCSGKDAKTTNAASTTTAVITTAPSTLPSTTSPSTGVDLSSLLFPIFRAVTLFHSASLFMMTISSF